MPYCLQTVSAAARVLALSLALFATLAAPAPAQGLSDPDVKEIGKAMGDYISADAKGLEKARVKLQASLEKAGKKVAEKNGDPVQAALSQSRDLAKAYALSIDYKAQRGGKINHEVLGRNQPDAVNLAVWLPATYKPSTGPYPLLLMVPPMKDGAPMAVETFLQEQWLEAGMREKAILIAVSMPEDLATWTGMGQNDGGGRLMRAFAFARDTYAIDYDRVFLVGRGEGVEAALALAAKFPDRFAGVVGRAGDAGKVLPNNFSNLPTFFQGAGAAATEFAEGCKKLGFENSTLKADATEADAWTWILEHPRSPNPKKVVLYPGAPFPTRAYWVRTVASDDTTHSVTAEADRATNTIRVESKGIDQLMLLFNDELVDLSKPLTVVLNGVEQKVVVPRNLDDMLGLLKSTNDGGRFYVAARSFDLPK